MARYSEDNGRAAIQRFLWRRLSGLFDLKFCAVVLALLGYLGWILWNGNRGWWMIWIAAAIVFIPSLVLGAYTVHWLRTVGRIRQTQAPMARFKLTETELVMASELSSATIPWSSILEVWEFPDLWLLLLSRSEFVTLPTDGVAGAALDFVRAKVRSVHEGAVPHTAT